jgi:hypothetical protein
MMRSWFAKFGNGAAGAQRTERLRKPRDAGRLIFQAIFFHEELTRIAQAARFV